MSASGTGAGVETGSPVPRHPDAATGPPAVSSGTLRALLGLLLAAAVAAGVLWINDSPLLPATHADGVKYLSSAASLAGGGELADPVARWSSPGDERFLSHFPPGYPLTLAALVRSGLRPHVAALWLTAASAGATAFLLFLVTSLLAGWWAGILAVLLFFAAPPVVLLHSTVWSEPLYLPLVVALVGTMALWPERSGIHGALAALGVLVRYAGVAGVAAAGGWAWYLWGRREGGRSEPWRPGGRWFAVALAVAPGIFALAVWGVVASARRESVRAFGFYGAGLGEDLAGLAGALVGWLAPVPGGGAAVRWAAALCVGVVVLLVWARALRAVSEPAGEDEAELGTGRTVDAEAGAEGGVGEGRPGDGGAAGPGAPARRRLWASAALFSACYVLTVVLARLFADHEIPFDTRIFAPVFLVATMVTAVALVEVVSSVRAATAADGAGASLPGKHPAVRRAAWPAAAAVAVAALWLGGSLWISATGIPVMKDQGRFYTAWTWFTSDIVRWVEGSGEWTHLYSNEPWLLLFQTGRTPRLLPTENDVGDWSAFEAVYRERPGPVVVLYPLRPDDLTPEELEARLGLRPELVRNEGVVLVPTADDSPTPASSIRGAAAQK